MATVAFSGELKLATVDYTSKVKSVDFSREQDLPDVTALGSSTRAVTAGLSGATMKVEFYWDSTIAAICQAYIGAAAHVAVVLGPDGTTSGYPKYTFNAWCKSVGTPITVGETKMLPVEFVVNGAVTTTTY